MRRNKLLFSLIFLTVSSGPLFAQTLVGTAGNTASQTNTSMSWSIGEPVTGASVNVANSFIAGFHQPQPLTVTAIFNDPERNFRVFPNPARGKVIIQRPIPGDYQLIIYDITGKSVEKSNWLSHEVEKEVLTSEWAAGVYIIKVFEKGRVVNESRLVKL